MDFFVRFYLFSHEYLHSVNCECALANFQSPDLNCVLDHKSFTFFPVYFRIFFQIASFSVALNNGSNAFLSRFHFQFCHFERFSDCWWANLCMDVGCLCWHFGNSENWWQNKIANRIPQTHIRKSSSVNDWSRHFTFQMTCIRLHKPLNHAMSHANVGNVIYLWIFVINIAKSRN